MKIHFVTGFAKWHIFRKIHFYYVQILRRKTTNRFQKKMIPVVICYRRQNQLQSQIIEKRKIFGCVCQSIYFSQGRFIRIMNLKNRSGFSNGNLQNRSIFICKGMENKCLFLISIGIYNGKAACWCLSGYRKSCHLLWPRLKCRSEQPLIRFHEKYRSGQDSCWQEWCRNSQ